MRVLLVVLAVMVSACAAQEHRRALITDRIPLLTKRLVVEQRMRQEQLCLRRRELRADAYVSCRVDRGDRWVVVDVYFGMEQQARAILVTVFIPPKRFSRDPALGLYRLEEMTKRAFVALGAELERRYGKGARTRRGGRSWVLPSETVRLYYSPQGHVHEVHMWRPEPRGPLIAGR